MGTWCWTSSDWTGSTSASMYPTLQTDGMPGLGTDMTACNPCEERSLPGEARRGTPGPAWRGSSAHGYGCAPTVGAPITQFAWRSQQAVTEQAGCQLGQQVIGKAQPGTPLSKGPGGPGATAKQLPGCHGRQCADSRRGSGSHSG